jgi:hypothetical protein
MAITQINGKQQIQSASIAAASVDASIIVAGGTHAFTGDQSHGGFKITNVAAPISGTDAANKTYVDNSVTGLLKYKGSTDCSLNPNYPAGIVGDAYVVSVAGKIGGASGTAVDIGDVYACNVANSGGTQASVGADWFILEHNLVGALLSANNLSDVGSPSTSRTNLGATTVGGNLFTAPNPSAITFLRVNADNSVSLLSASAFRTAIGGGASVNFATRETPSGTVNGSNVTFTVANTPISGTESVFTNGVLQDSGAGADYTISTSTITFLTGSIPQTGDKVRVSYQY